MAEMKHEWTLDHGYRTFWGCLPWMCIHCGQLVDTQIDLGRLRPCGEAR